MHSQDVNSIFLVTSRQCSNEINPSHNTLLKQNHMRGGGGAYGGRGGYRKKNPGYATELYIGYRYYDEKGTS